MFHGYVVSRRDRAGNLGMGSTVVRIWKILPRMGEGTSRKCVYVRVETERTLDEMVVVVVVECYCFLINIIVDARRRATPPKPMRFCYFQQKCVHSSHKTMARRIQLLVVVACF